MNCVICFDNMKSNLIFVGGDHTNWSQKCVSCKDSWVCGSCYHNWDANHSGPVFYKTMPCVICKRDMIYSKFVNEFDNNDSGWWDDVSWGPLWDMLDRNSEM